jgi:hypothetical protein
MGAEWHLTARCTPTLGKRCSTRLLARVTVDVRSAVKRPAALAFILAAIASAAIWASSPLVTGHKEPWDAEGFFYFGSLFAIGVISGFSIPKPLWAHYLGSVLGQMTYELIFLPLGPLFVLGVGFLLGYSLLFLVGALIGSRLRRYFNARTSAA